MNQDEAIETECNWQGDLGDLAGHKTNDCPLLQVVCEHCTMSLKRYELNEHYEQCPFLPVACDHCTASSKRCEMEQHIEQCPEVRLQCPLKCSLVDICYRSYTY